MSSKAIVHLNGKVYELQMEDNETLLEACLRYNLDAPYACMAAACTQCKAVLLSGEVDMDDNGPLSQAELNLGHILTCQSRPRNGQNVEFEYQEEL